MSTYKPKWPRRTYLGPAGDAQAKREAARKQSATAKPKTRQQPARRPRKAIKRRSAKMTKLMEQYRKQKAVFLAKYPWCMVHGKPCRSAEIHHSRGRVGTLLLDERFWFAVCSSSHYWIHDEPAMARADGYLCDVGLWNKPVPLNIEPLSDENTRDLPH